jgi:hypothetical protein
MQARLRDASQPQGSKRHNRASPRGSRFNRVLGFWLLSRLLPRPSSYRCSSYLGHTITSQFSESCLAWRLITYTAREPHSAIVARLQLAQPMLIQYRSRAAGHKLDRPPGGKQVALQLKNEERPTAAESCLSTFASWLMREPNFVCPRGGGEEGFEFDSSRRILPPALSDEGEKIPGASLDTARGVAPGPSTILVSVPAQGLGRLAGRKGSRQDVLACWLARWRPCRLEAQHPTPTTSANWRLRRTLAQPLGGTLSLSDASAPAGSITRNK